MNFIKSSLLIATASLAMASTASAEEKIVTVDMQKLFKDYYKTHEAQKELNAFRARIQNENAERVTKIQAIEKELNEMKKQIEDTSIAEAKRKEINESFALKRSEGVAMETERREYVERRNKSLAEQMNQKMRAIIDDINKLVDEKAKAADYDFVLDSSAITPSQTKVFMFAKEKFDVTGTIMKDLNKDAPADFDPSKPVEGAEGVAPAPAPAAN